MLKFFESGSIRENLKIERKKKMKLMKKIIGIFCLLFMAVSVWAGTLGEGIGVADLTWTSEGDEGPWYYSADGGYSGGTCVVSGGGGGGVATSKLQASITGPCRISFKYLVQTYTGTYTVKSDDTVLYTWTGITGTGAQWQSAQYDIPTGMHTIEFSYTHQGVGYANQFNGVKICELTIQQTGSTSNANRTLYVSPNGNDSNDGMSWATAKATIQAAVDASFASDTIRVASGTYSPIITNNKLLTIIGEGASSTIIDGNCLRRCVTVMPDGATSGIYTNTVVIGFTLLNGWAASASDSNNGSGGALKVEG